ncbi:RNA-binding protein [Candidatus Nomurabacteria bacterium RIFCSPLOWO2_01_FULL_42_20]|nr:MAG: RNA-binding protein [Candidatus Nomurabacteria bacterium RIFCSPLOWO2_01_FULL_42_20]
MATKLYVGGLPYSSTEDSLRDHFSQAGNVVSATIIKDKMSGRSKGFGFVEMSTEEEANKAIETFDGQDFDGRKLTVNIARPMEERPPRRSFGGGGGGGRGGDRGGRSY